MGSSSLLEEEELEMMLIVLPVLEERSLRAFSAAEGGFAAAGPTESLRTFALPPAVVCAPRFAEANESVPCFNV